MARGGRGHCLWAWPLPFIIAYNHCPETTANGFPATSTGARDVTHMGFPLHPLSIWALMIFFILKIENLY